MKYIHYHVVRQTVIGTRELLADDDNVPMYFTLDNATREAVWRNVMDPDSTYRAGFCRDPRCDRTRKPI